MIRGTRGRGRGHKTPLKNNKRKRYRTRMKVGRAVPPSRRMRWRFTTDTPDY
jgi:hypothetical protein